MTPRVPFTLCALTAAIHAAHAGLHLVATLVLLAWLALTLRQDRARHDARTRTWVDCGGQVSR